MTKYKRWTEKRKAEVAIALLKVQSLEEVSRATGQPARAIHREVRLNTRVT